MDALTELALRAGRGDRRALESFVRQTQVDVWRLCAHLGDAGAADDLAQETFARAVPALRRFRGDASARTWLLAIARNVCAEHVRRSQRRRTFFRRDARPPAPSTPSHVSDVWLDVQALREQQRVALVLTQVLGLSYQEAAESCGVPVGTIRSRVARAREALLADGVAEASGDGD